MRDHKIWDVGHIRVDSQFIEEHSLGPLRHRHLDLVVRESVGLPAFIFFWILAGRHGGLRFHEYDFPLNIDPGIVVIIKFRSHDAVTRINHLGREFAITRLRAWIVIPLIFICFFPPAAFRLIVVGELTAHKDSGVWIGIGLEVGIVISCRFETPFLEERSHPTGAASVFRCSCQASSIIIRGQFLDII